MRNRHRRHAEATREAAACGAPGYQQQAAKEAAEKAEEIHKERTARYGNWCVCGCEPPACDSTSGDEVRTVPMATTVTTGRDPTGWGR